MNIKLKLWHWQQWQKKSKKNEREKKLWRLTGILKKCDAKMKNKKNWKKEKRYDVGDNKGTKGNRKRIKMRKRKIWNRISTRRPK